MLKIERINPGPPWTQIVIHGDIVYLVGTTAKDTFQDVKGQAKEILSAIHALLSAAGGEVTLADGRQRRLSQGFTVNVTDALPLDGIENPAMGAGIALASEVPLRTASCWASTKFPRNSYAGSPPAAGVSL